MRRLREVFRRTSQAAARLDRWSGSRHLLRDAFEWPTSREPRLQRERNRLQKDWAVWSPPHLTSRCRGPKLGGYDPARGQDGRCSKKNLGCCVGLGGFVL